MRAYSLGIGELISLPQHGLTIEVLDVQDDQVRLGITGPLSLEFAERKSLNYREEIVFLELAG